MNEFIQGIISIMGFHYKKLDDVNNSINHIERLRKKNLINSVVYEKEKNNLLVKKQEIETHINKCLSVLKN